MKSTIRPARAEDLPAIAQLAGRLVRLHHQWDPQRFLRIADPEAGYRRFLAQELENPQAVVHVAELDGGVQGYAYGSLEPRSWSDLREACGKLHDLYVDDAARGRGLARALVESCVAALEALGAPRVVLMAAARNPEARAVFAHLGFRETMIEMTRERGG